MAKNIVELEDEELEVVKEYRENRRAQRQQQFFQFEILKTACEYEEWLRKTGAGSSYSTFCDDFSYPSVNSRKKIFEAVEEIRKLAWLKAA